MKVVVVGAGIVGAACADALASSNFHVTLVDRQGPGTGTTATGMGHVVVMDDSPAQLALTRYSRHLWRRLAPDLPPDCEHESCGTIWVAADDEEWAAVQAKDRTYRAHQIETEILSPTALRELEPNLRPGLAGGLLVPSDSVVYPPRATAFLAERARQHGAQLLFGRTARKIDPHAVWLENGDRLDADAVVNAAGCQAPDLTPELPLRPRKGHLVITERYPGFVRHQLVELGYLKSAHAVSTDSVAFNIQPRATGQALLGSSRQYDNLQPEVDPLILQRMIRRALEFMPGLARLAASRVWTGFRPATPDKLPYIGPIPDQPGLWVAAGHEGLGITTALGTAALLSDLLLNRPTAIPAEPYLPARMLQAPAA